MKLVRLNHDMLTDLRAFFPDVWPDDTSPVLGYLYTFGTDTPGYIAHEPNGRYDAGDMVGKFDTLPEAEKALLKFFIDNV